MIDIDSIHIFAVVLLPCDATQSLVVSNAMASRLSIHLTVTLKY